MFNKSCDIKVQNTGKASIAPPPLSPKMKTANEQFGGKARSFVLWKKICEEITNYPRNISVQHDWAIVLTRLNATVWRALHRAISSLVRSRIPQNHIKSFIRIIIKGHHNRYLCPRWFGNATLDKLHCQTENGFYLYLQKSFLVVRATKKRTFLRLP